MKTMRCASTKTMVISGFLLAILASTMSALTGTGVAGTYAFGLIGLFLLLFFLMWPERRRFRSKTSSSHPFAKRQ
jgi:hypothetical protein